ncbi:MAG: HNH endonuclease [Akkermansia sp.]|nr:HNH endonuclease [Akkermansia sp.]
MNPISFGTYIRRDAYRNGWDNCEPDADGTGRWLSSTAHEGLLHVFPDGDLFVIVPTYQPICRVPLAELASTLRELSQSDTAPKGEPPLRTERQQMVTTRTAQHRYRAGQEKIWSSKCPLTGVTIPALLRASHAKPWKDCTDTERIDPHNGFLLEARMDALFAQGFISFDDDGKLMISVRLGRDEIQKLGLSGVQGLPWVNSAHFPYLRWHREHVFKRL